jgi:transcriptional regulator with XRE-family HTH domain/Zn-dependent peptidase ImmA (M78 family)
MKVRQARTDAGLTLSEFAEACELSPSYVTEIEKGRKYPRSDKIVRMAAVLNKDYDDLVSIKLPPSLTYLESTLSSSVIQRFPFEEFGFEAGDLVNLLTRKPDKASALLHAGLEIARRYNLQEEEFLRAALRSYQEIHENYFPEVEDAAGRFVAEFGLNYPLEKGRPVKLSTLEAILREAYGYTIDDSTLANTADLTKYRSVFIPGKEPHLYFNNALYSRQVKFILARELGYNYLGLKERSQTSTPEKINSFQQLLNDFKAAYFGGALLMPQTSVREDLQAFFDTETWNPKLLTGMLMKYNVTPEMLFYRFSELVPQFFGLKLHFLRFHHVSGSKNYQLIKRLNMNQLLLPSGIGLNEHYCRRWLSIKLLREISAQDIPKTAEEMPVGVQLSEFLESQDKFLSIGFARQLVLSPSIFSSVVVGFRVDPVANQTIRFLEDPAIPHIIINETCEMCSLTANQCHLRGAEPILIQQQEEARARKLAINMLRDQ